MVASKTDESSPVIPETFPISTKQALLRKAQDLGLDGSYSARGWSNRLGSVLTPVADGVYTADRPFYWNNIDVGCRMTVIELPSSTGASKDLFVHSPVSLDGPLITALKDIGNVKHVLSPNYEHVKFAGQWAKQYPDANMWACPGMMEKEPEVRWTGEVPYGCRPATWRGRTINDGEPSSTNFPDGFWDTNEIQLLHMDTESVPVLNIPFFNEVIFYHESSKTLMTTDLYWNYPAGDGVTNSQYSSFTTFDERSSGAWELAPALPERVPRSSLLWKMGMDKLFQPFYMNLMVTDRSKFDEIVDFLLLDEEGTWAEATTVIPAHGDIVRGRPLIKEVFEKHFNRK